MLKLLVRYLCILCLCLFQFEDASPFQVHLIYTLDLLRLLSCHFLLELRLLLIVRQHFRVLFARFLYLPSRDGKACLPHHLVLIGLALITRFLVFVTFFLKCILLPLYARLRIGRGIDSGR